ncbi:hypothetical protein ACFV4F_35975 [Kitasatospora sp. NPDC059722]|uniref:hypothetical protein n=1 Tax=Kitasatospora sp. NPDC059722 TaxID=3346925 RepID=UPI0036AA8DAF
MGNLADAYGTDVEIYEGADGQIRADCRTDAPLRVERILREFGFTAPPDPGNPASYSLPPHRPSADQRSAASGAAGLLDDTGYRVAIEPELVVGYVGLDSISLPDEQRLAAARQTSPAATATPAPAPAAAPPAVTRPTGRTR